MKFRILGTLFVLAVLAVVAVVTSEPSNAPVRQVEQPDSSVQPIRIP